MSAQALAADSRSLAFRREREVGWRELDALVSRVETEGLAALGSRELMRLPSLYRAALSSLAIARSISLDRNLLDYLEALVDRAYLCVYGTRKRAGETIVAFFGARFPRTVRRFAGPIGLAAVILALGTAAGTALVLRDESHFDSFVSGALAEGRGPQASTAELRRVLYTTEPSGGGALNVLASFLFTHNAKIGMTCFAVGVLGGLPVFLLLLTNGLMLGAFAGLYQGRGLGVEFWAWVLPHGLTELGAVALCGGAGLALAQAAVFPGELSRLDCLARRGREAAVIILGAIACFFVAACLEGFFRQLVQSVPIRYSVAALSAALWAIYFTRAGREPR